MMMEMYMPENSEMVYLMGKAVFTMMMGTITLVTTNRE